MSEETNWDGLVTRYRDNLNHVTDCVKFAGRIRASFVAAFGWPGDDDSRGLCYWSRVEPLGEMGERYVRDDGQFVVGRNGLVRGDLCVCVRVDGNESAELRMPMTFYRNKDGTLAAQVETAESGKNGLVAAATDEELSRGIRDAMEPLLVRHVAECFS